MMMMIRRRRRGRRRRGGHRGCCNLQHVMSRCHDTCKKGVKERFCVAGRVSLFLGTLLFPGHSRHGQSLSAVACQAHGIGGHSMTFSASLIFLP